MTAGDEQSIFAQPPIALTFLAPADRCNQRCPRCYLTEVVHEPVHETTLGPLDFAHLVHELVGEDMAILSVAFQGYEVTLPRSWPYVEATFAAAAEHGLRRSFITNGMLLHKVADRVDALDPARISVSLDGADATVNDRLRGLEGAFEATLRSLRVFLKKAPRFQERLVIASCLYDEDNFRSLLALPLLARELGLQRWALSLELREQDGRARPCAAPSTVTRWIRELSQAAAAHGVECHVNDEFGFFEGLDPTLPIHRVFNANFLYRVEPSGHIRVGHEILDVWDPASARPWHPGVDRAIDVVEYWLAVSDLLT